MIDINFISPTGGLVKSVNGKTGNVVLTALDIQGTATEEYVIAKIAEAQLAEGGEVDLTAYATKDYVNQQIDGIEIPEPADLTNYYTKAETDTAISTAIGAIEIPEGGSADLSNYYTKSEVDALIPEEVDLTGYALKTEIPDVSGFTTMSAVEAKGYQTADDVNALITTAIGNITDADGVNY